MTGFLSKTVSLAYYEKVYYIPTSPVLIFIYIYSYTYVYLYISDIYIYICYIFVCISPYLIDKSSFSLLCKLKHLWLQWRSNFFPTVVNLYFFFYELYPPIVSCVVVRTKAEHQENALVWHLSIQNRIRKTQVPFFISSGLCQSSLELHELGAFPCI